MAKITAFAAAIALSMASPAAADSIDRWDRHIAEASARFAIPTDWIKRVMRAESAGRTHLDGRPITSRAGAMGLMQLMPPTWAALRNRINLGSDPHDPRDNILAGTAYLRAMYDRFGYPGMFAAYNAGPGRYAQYLRGERSLPAETVAYLADVGGVPTLPESAATTMERPINAIFFALEERNQSTPTTSDNRRRSSLFVPLMRSADSED
ncbi:MAG: lytic transglycosylase domain-containing protein [Pseudomonadota bacterium]